LGSEKQEQAVPDQATEPEQQVLDGTATSEAVPVARWRAFAERQMRAVRVLILTCIVFGLAAAAFAWTTIRVHDRQVTAENRERDVAHVLAAPDTRSATQPARGGGTVTAYYSPMLSRAVIVERSLPRLADGRSYAFWYLDGSGTTRPIGSSRFDKPRNDLVLASVPASVPTNAQLEVTVESSGDAKKPTTPPLAVLPLG
jgi:hypothetical protein